MSQRHYWPVKRARTSTCGSGRTLFGVPGEDRDVGFEVVAHGERSATGGFVPYGEGWGKRRMRRASGREAGRAATKAGTMPVSRETATS